VRFYEGVGQLPLRVNDAEAIALELVSVGTVFPKRLTLALELVRLRRPQSPGSAGDAGA